MNETYKALAHAASANCEILKTNEPWVWEREYAKLIIESILELEKYSSDTGSYVEILDILSKFGIEEEY